MRNALEDLRHAPARDLRVGAGDERRRIDEVDEQNGCQLAFHEPKCMNDRAAVKSPENPGFKPKNRSSQNRPLRVPCLVPTQHPIRCKTFAFRRNTAKADKNRTQTAGPSFDSGCVEDECPPPLGLSACKGPRSASPLPSGHAAGRIPRSPGAASSKLAVPRSAFAAGAPLVGRS